MKKISEFLSENFDFLMVKFSIYLNRRVSIMFVGPVKTLPRVSSPHKLEPTENIPINYLKV